MIVSHNAIAEIGALLDLVSNQKKASAFIKEYREAEDARNAALGKLNSEKEEAERKNAEADSVLESARAEAESIREAAMASMDEKRRALTAAEEEIERRKADLVREAGEMSNRELALRKAEKSAAATQAAADKRLAEAEEYAAQAKARLDKVIAAAA